MFRDVFSQKYPIRWVHNEDDRTHASPFRDFLRQLAEEERETLLARMRQFAEMGKWDVRVNFIKTLTLSGQAARRAEPDGISIIEIKRHQERVLFFRRTDLAVIVHQMKKKNDWSKKDARELEVAVDRACNLLSQLTTDGPPKDERK